MWSGFGQTSLSFKNNLITFHQGEKIKEIEVERLIYEKSVLYCIFSLVGLLEVFK